MPKKKEVPKELKPILDDIEQLRKELDRLMESVSKGLKEVKSDVKKTTGKSIKSFARNDLSIVNDLYKDLKEESQDFKISLERIRDAIEKGFKGLYVLMVIREIIPLEYIPDFAKKIYGIVANDPNISAMEISKAAVKRDDVNRIIEEARKYLASAGLVVDIINMTPEEIRKEFEDNQKYPDVESIRRKLPEEFRSIIKRNIKKKQTAINKILEEMEKLKGIRRLSGNIN
jgi:hypothetical protein